MVLSFVHSPKGSLAYLCPLPQLQMTSVISETAFPICQKHSETENVPISFRDKQQMANEMDSSDHQQPNAPKQYSSLLIHSCARGLKNIVEELILDEHINVNLEDTEGNTALIHAAQAGHTQIIELLIDRFSKLEIDHVNKLGQTALIKAAIQGRANCARTLLKAGADPYRKDNGRHMTALEWAKFVGRTECGRMIREFMEPKRGGDRLSLHNTAQNNFKQVACVAAIPLIGGGVCEVPALARPRVRSAPPTPIVKIRITPPPSPFCQNLSAQSESHSPKQFPFKMTANQNNSSKKRPLRTEERPKSSAV